MKICLVGACGKMGREITKLILQDPECELVCAVIGDTNTHDRMQYIKNLEYQGINPEIEGQIHKLKSKIEEMDIMIDFSIGRMFGDVVYYANERRIPLVSGITGEVCGPSGIPFASPDQYLNKNWTEENALKIPVLWDANMSLGINLIKFFSKKIKEKLDGFDVCIEDLHHNKKKDSPSGTAKSLASYLNMNSDRIMGSPGMGGIFGDHSVKFASEEELIEINHRAINRAVFARGAIQAAKWLVGQKSNGLYNMFDVLGLHG